MVLLIHTLTHSLTDTGIGQSSQGEKKQCRNLVQGLFFSFDNKRRRNEFPPVSQSPWSCPPNEVQPREQSTQVFFSPEMQVKGEKTRERQGNKRREKKVKATQVVEQQNKKWAKETGLWKPGFG